MMDFLPKQHILVVDDDKEIARLVRRYLEEARYAVLVVYDGETAVQALRREVFDLVVLDLGLPDRDGWDITRLIRSDDRLNTLPIIMLTARIDDSDKIIGLELGADDYIPKPFNAREVVARVRALLRRVHMTTLPQRKIWRVDGLALDVNSRALTVNGNMVELTPTEYELMVTFMSHPIPGQMKVVIFGA